MKCYKNYKLLIPLSGFSSWLSKNSNITWCILSIKKVGNIYTNVQDCRTETNCTGWLWKLPLFTFWSGMASFKARRQTRYGRSPLHRARQDLATSVSLDMSLNLSETQCIYKRKGLDRWFFRNLPDMKFYDSVSHLYSNVSKWRKRNEVVTVVQLPTLCDPMDCSTPGLPVPYHLLEFTQVHIHCIGDAVQPPHPLTPSSSSALNLSQL